MVLATRKERAKTIHNGAKHTYTHKVSSCKLHLLRSWPSKTIIRETISRPARVCGCAPVRENQSLGTCVSERQSEHSLVMLWTRWRLFDGICVILDPLFPPQNGPCPNAMWLLARVKMSFDVFKSLESSIVLGAQISSCVSCDCRISTFCWVCFISLALAQGSPNYGPGIACDPRKPTMRFCFVKDERIVLFCFNNGKWL